MNGTVFNVQRACTRDGPGIRTTVFLSGCPLACRWCHNPESQSVTPQILYDASRCTGCLRCVAACPARCHTRGDDGSHHFDRAACTACGRCLSPLCPALERSGREWSAAEVIAEVLRDRDYYDRSGGGVTLSGGEPLFQGDFCLELLRLAKENGLHTCLETCGFASASLVERSADLTDLWLYDWKETDPDRHRAFTGVDNRPILENLLLLDRLGARIVLRCPIIPGVNDRPDHFRGIAALAERLRNVERVTVEPYHTLGVNKYARLGRTYALSDVAGPDGDTVSRWISGIRENTTVEVEKA